MRALWSLNRLPLLPSALIVFTLSISYTAAAAAAGGLDGGGGIGILCHGKLQTLDLYEGSVIRNLEPLEDPGSLKQDMAFYLEQFTKNPRSANGDGLDPSLVKDALKFLRERVEFVDGPLPPTKDASLPPLGDGCRPVQIARQTGQRDYLDAMSLAYEKTVKVKINRKYWKMLSPRDQAALLIHEMFYMARRKDEDTSRSDDTRANVIAHFFQGSEPLLEPLWSNPRKLECWSAFQVPHRKGEKDPHVIFTGEKGKEVPPDGGFHQYEDSRWYVIESEQDGVKGLLFLFSRIGQEELASRTTMFVPGLTLDGYTNGSKPIHGVISQKFDGRRWSFEAGPGPAPDQTVGGGPDDHQWIKATISAPDGSRVDPMADGKYVFGRCTDWDAFNAKAQADLKNLRAAFPQLGGKAPDQSPPGDEPDPAGSSTSAR